MDTYIQQLLGGGAEGSNSAGTRYAGRVWTDKTVFASGDASDYVLGSNTQLQGTNPWDPETNTLTLDMATDGKNDTITSNEDFLHVFSALGSSQILNEYAPVDLALVLDISGSMGSPEPNEPNGL